MSIRFRKKKCYNVPKGNSRPPNKRITTDLSLSDIIELLKQGELRYGEDSSSLSDIIKRLEIHSTYGKLGNSENSIRSDNPHTMYYHDFSDLCQREDQYKEDVLKKLKIVQELCFKDSCEHSCFGKFIRDRTCYICYLHGCNIYEACYKKYIEDPKNVDAEFKKIMPEICSRIGHKNWCTRLMTSCNPSSDCIPYAKKVK